MTYRTDTANRPRQTPGFDISGLDRIDRILLGSCAAVWLAALGAGVAATVALVSLAGGRTGTSSESGTPWILYTIIAVSAAVIAAAVPLLLRARRAAAQDDAPAPQRPAAAEAPPQPEAPLRGADAPTEKLRVSPAAPAAPASEAAAAAAPGPTPAGQTEPDLPAVDRIWLRCAAGIAGVMGVATFLTAVSTYLMAVDSNTVAWVLYVIAGLVTAGMAAIPWYALHDLQALIDDAD